MQSILLYSIVLSQRRRSTYMRRDAGEEGGREFSSKMPRTMSNLPDFPCHPFQYVHLYVYTKSMVEVNKFSTQFSTNERQNLLK